MSTLGNLLGATRRAAAGFEAWLQASDPPLALRVEAAAAERHLAPAGYIRAAIADFSRFASEEDWATLMSSVRDSDDPGISCLKAMVDWRLAATGCREHSHRASNARSVR